MAVDIHTRDLGRLVAEYHGRGEPAPIINVLGHHPAFHLGGLAPMDFGNDDYATIGAFLGEPLRVTPSVTWGEQFLVPADAEVVIEGEIPPGERAICDPFGEVAGLYQAQCLRWVFEVKAITHRPGAILQDIFSGFRDGWTLGAVPKEGSLVEALRKQYPSVAAVHLPDSGAGRLAAYISIGDPVADPPEAVGRTALELSSGVQCVVVVDDALDVYDEVQVLWAVQTYADPTRGLAVHTDLPASFFTTAWQGRKVVLDATRPRNVPFPSRSEVPAEALRRVDDLNEWLD
jgi:UbiD family decarboxylase